MMSNVITVYSHYQASAALETFIYKINKVLTFLYKNREPWFIVVDLNRLLSRPSAKDAIRILDDDEKSRHIAPHTRRLQKLVAINLTQELFVVKSSKVENAVRYQTYITLKGLEYFSMKNTETQKFLLTNEARESNYADI